MQTFDVILQATIKRYNRNLKTVLVPLTMVRMTFLS